MDAETFKVRTKRLKEVNSVISKLDPAIRAEAFSILSGYVTGHVTKGPAARGAAHDVAETDDAESFFEKHQSSKPSDNAFACAAYLYSQYGKQSFRLDDIRNLAEGAGVTIPDYFDMTLKQAKRDGKALFQHVGTNQYKPTVHGEIYFKKTYSVKKGTKQRPAEGKS